MIARTGTLKRLLATARLAATATLVSPPAPAQNAKAAAESLFQAAKQLMADKKYADACPKFAESQKLDPAPGTLLNLARCYEALGKTASAWVEYKAAAALAGQLGQKDREEGARDLAAKLEPKLSKLTIVAAATPGLVVTSDGVEIGAATFGTPLSVDPGEHVIQASAPGYKAWSAKVVVGPNADSKTASIPTLEKEAGPVPTATAVPATTAPATATVAPTAPPTAEPTATSTVPPPEGSSSMRTASYVLMGAGVVGIGVGAVFGGLAASDVGNAQSDPALCPDKVCTPAGRAAINDASTKALISTIALPVGLAAAGAGVVLFFVSAPKSPEKASLPARRSVAVSPVIGSDGAALSVRGRF
jgi:hypothetical protein